MPTDPANQPPQRFEELARESEDRGLLADLFDFLKTTRKWWLTPIIVALLLLGALVLLSVSGVGPAIYPLF